MFESQFVMPFGTRTVPKLRPGGRPLHCRTAHGGLALETKLAFDPSMRIRPLTVFAAAIRNGARTRCTLDTSVQTKRRATTHAHIPECVQVQKWYFAELRCTCTPLHDHKIVPVAIRHAIRAVNSNVKCGPTCALRGR